MRATGWSRPNPVDVAWAVFAALNVAAMIRWPSWETVPFHFVWISLTLVYGFSVWGPRMTTIVLAAVAVATGGSILADAFAGIQLWGELFEVPLMSAMFLAMVWHARRRQDALRLAEERTEVQRSLLARQERFLQDVSHELRTPVTIARGHLEILRQVEGDGRSEISVALDELERIDTIVEHLLLLVEAGQPDFLNPAEVDLEPYVEDIFMRWSEVAPRAWLLGPVPPGSLAADPERLRTALDALLENAVKHTEPDGRIELRALAEGQTLVIEVADTGGGIPPEALDRIFERFARADPARSRAHGGVGLGLAIVDAIVKRHGGRCSVRSSPRGSVFAIRLPGFRPPARRPSVAPSSTAAQTVPATS